MYVCRYTPVGGGSSLFMQVTRHLAAHRDGLRPSGRALQQMGLRLRVQGLGFRGLGFGGGRNSQYIPLFPWVLLKIS